MRPLRVLLWLALVVGTLAMLAGPAWAHGSDVDASNFRSIITATPDLPGLTWRVLHHDDRLWVRNDSRHDVVVLGHQGEPYLRIGPNGVFENTASPTVALHRERYATDVGTSEPHGGAVAWRRVSTDADWSWHDHRIHWMSPRAPALDRETVLIPSWTVPVLVDGSPAAVTGELRWIPPPPVWPWLLAGLALSLPALAGLRATPEPGGSWRRGLRPAAGVLAAVALLNVAHLADGLAAPEPLEARLFAGVQTLLYLGLGLGGALRARRGDHAGLTALGVGAFALFLGQGLLYLPALSSSQIATVLPHWLVRLSVGVSLAQLVPIGVVLWRGGRTVRPAVATAQATSSN